MACLRKQSLMLIQNDLGARCIDTTRPLLRSAPRSSHERRTNWPVLIAGDAASFATPPTPSGVDQRRGTPPAGTHVPPAQESYSFVRLEYLQDLLRLCVSTESLSAVARMARSSPQAEPVLSPEPPLTFDRRAQRKQLLRFFAFVL